MKEKFLLQEQLSDEKVRVKNMQMKLTEVESALSDWKQKYSEMQREYRAYVAKVEANGFKYLMINLKKWIKNNYLLTLSKILCKWKQDSAVSLFLYLNSVFKNKHKLIHNQAPVMNRLCPFLLNLHK